MSIEFSIHCLSFAILLDWDQPAQLPQGTFYKPKFFKFMQEEYQACQEGVGIIDMSSFSKILIKVDYH